MSVIASVASVTMTLLGLSSSTVMAAPALPPAVTEDAGGVEKSSCATGGITLKGLLGAEIEVGGMLAGFSDRVAVSKSPLPSPLMLSAE